MSQPKKPSPPPVAAKVSAKAKAAKSAGGGVQWRYPGLNFYESEYAPYFAGRDREIELCGRTLLKSNLMLLHGATGCGKSSFLRAGVKPHIARLGHGEGFVGETDKLKVIRSTDEPLVELAKEVRTLADGLTKKTTKRGQSPAALRALFEDPRIGPRIGREADATLLAVRTLAEVMEPAPILVIDQAEEVFTLNTVRRREARLHKKLRNLGEPLRDLKPEEIEEREREIDQYFRFLWEIAANKDAANNGLRVVVSMRTEYKGQFDDRIARIRNQHPGQGLTGFYLDQLGEEGLIEAIRRPTLKKDEWDQLAADGRVAGEWPKRPDGALAFEFHSKRSKSDPTRTPHYVAARLASDLLTGDAIPAGGVLPALQVACLRLYKQASKAMEGAEGVFTVRLTHLRRLGSVQNQIHEYLSECIEEECAPHAPQERSSDDDVGKEKVEFGELVDTFHRALADTLVGSEADGRAVTEQLEDDAFRAVLRTWFSGRLDIDKVMAIMESLKSKHGLLRKDEFGRWTLGHDSLALALNKWRLAFSREDGGMRAMMMGMSRRPKDWDIDDLYEKDQRPGPLKIWLTRDYFWDRQIPHYALHKGFAKRLNITFDSSDLELSGLVADTRKRTGKNGERRWRDVVAAACAAERDLDGSARGKGYNGERVMVSAEWGAFPFILRKEKSADDKPDDESDDMFDDPLNHDDVSKYAPLWTDVAPTNINLGTGLIGSPLDDVPPIEDREGKADEERLRGYRRTIRASLLALTAHGANFLPASLGGIRMLQFAADLAFVPADGDAEETKKEIGANRKRVHAFLKEMESTKTLADQPYTAREPIVKHLLQGVFNDDETPRFATGGAFARALARQSGFRVYFGAKHVATLARAAMEARARKDETYYAGNRKDDLAARTQKCLAHTLWTLGITPAQASFGQERAAVLRLASVSYFTTEYLRTNMDDFVAYIQHFVNRFLADDAPGRESMRGVRIGRDEVRNAMRECFTFARFDELGEDVFDLDSVFAYWSDQGRFGAKSMAGAIYQDLVTLREQTLDHFQSCAESIAWLRYNGAYEPSTDKEVGEAFEAKERAWRHFKIYNFYDSERYMNKAAQKLLARIEAVAKRKSEEAKRPSESQRK